MDENGRLIIVANRLPFQLIRQEKETIIRESDGGLVSALKSYFENSNNRKFKEIVWIGTAEFAEKRWLKFNVGKAALNYNVVPLFMDKKLYNNYYNGFCNSTIWPLCHYFPSYVEFDSQAFEAYESINELFFEKVSAILAPEDTVWVHDYHLMLLPGLLRQHHPSATIGFFLHIPFPSYEIFRILHGSWKDKIIRGLLGADLIGFHTNEYVQHFLKTVQMLMGYDYKFRNIFLPDRVVKAEMFPIGIDFEKFNSGRDLPEVQETISSIRGNFKNLKIIFSVDRLDYTKGITHRLSGFEKFLEKYPQWVGEIVFVLVVVPSRQFVSKYTERKQMIEEQIGRINGRYSTLEWQPIIYRYSSLSFAELSGLYNCADVALITPLRDGMNLVAKEFVASKEETGVLILSELAGAANELGEALLVNPMDKMQVADALQEALLMPSDLKGRKMKILQSRLKRYSVTQWVNDFIKQLNETKEMQAEQRTRYFSSRHYDLMIQAYHQAGRRLMLLDYDGTLVKFSRDPSEAKPDPRLLGLLAELCADERNDVAIVSGRDSATLHHWFGTLPLILISEHGAGIRARGSEWKYFLSIDQSWKKNILPTLDVYCQRSPGSFIEEKTHTLVWHYRSVEQDLGFLRSRELLDNLYHMIRNSNLQVIDGNKVIEIRLAGINKGAVTSKLLQQRNYEFTLAIGDDKTDEDMFAVLPGDSFTIKVGVGHTRARFALTEPEDVIHLLYLITSEKEKEADVLTPGN